MNKKNFIAILLQKHERAEPFMEDRAFKLNDPRYTRKNFIEGYKYALLEIQTLVESFNGDIIKDENGQTNYVDKEFLNQIKHKA